jgi:hypothetical protein
MATTAQIEALEDHFLNLNGGFLNLDNVRQISRLRYLGRERFTTNRVEEKAVETRIPVGNHVAGSCAVHVTSKIMDLERDVYKAPAGMSGEELKDEVLTFKLSNMKAMNYFEAKALAKHLGIEGYAKMNKEALYSALEAKQAEREQKATETKAVAKPKVGNGYGVGQEVRFRDSKKNLVTGVITQVCKKMLVVTSNETGKPVWIYYSQTEPVEVRKEAGIKI